MGYGSLSIQTTDHVLVITIIDPVSRPVEIARLSNELGDLWAEIVMKEDIRVAIVAGTGEDFFLRTDPVKSLSMGRWPIAGRIGEMDVPVIAAINGDALGQGLELALACDIRLSVETSHFGLPQIMDGLIPWDGGTQRLSRLVGRGKALEMLLTGETIDAAEAYRVGLVHKIVSSGGVMDAALDLAREMASKGPVALRFTKEAIYKGMDLTLEQGLRLEADLYFLLHTTQDRGEGIKAFREKKPPRFEGK